MASPKHTRANDNCYRFSRLLVDIGTSVLRKLLEVKAGQQAANVDALFQIPRVRLKLKKLCPGTIYQSQLDLLYPPGGGVVDVNTWDITLLACVLLNVGKLSKQETVKVKDIRDVRIDLYGHVPRVSMDNEAYTMEWTRLTGIIKDLLTFCNDTAFEIETNDFIEFVKHERETDVYLQIVETWKDEEPLFVETRASKRIKEHLEKQNIVTISGHSGSGKSAIAHHVALSYASQGYTILPVSRAEEIKQLGNVKEKQLFVIDDPVGKNQLDHHELQLYERYHDYLDTLLEAGSKIMFTCRTYICRDGDFKSQTTVIGRNVIILYDGEYRLTVCERRTILKKHLKVPGLSSVEATLANKEFLNYPFLCRMYASNPLYHNRGIEFFDKPIDIFQEELDRMDPKKYCALVLCMMCNDRVETDMFNPFHVKYTETELKVTQIMAACGLETTFSRANLLDAIDSLVGTFLIKEGTHFRFMHDILYDVTALHFGNRYPCVVLEHASSNFIREYVRAEKDKDNFNHVVLIEDIHFPILAERLVADITDGHLFGVFLNPLFFNRNVQMALQQYVQNMTQYEVYHMTSQSKQSINKEQIDKHIGDNSYGNKLWVILHALLLEGKGMIHWLLSFGHIELFRVIFQKLSLPDNNWSKLPSNKNLLAFACLSGDLNIVKIISEKWNYGKETLETEYRDAMLMAGLSGNPNIARYISEQETDVTYDSFDGLTPLHMVGLSDTMSADDTKEIVSLLLDLGLCINKCAKNDVSPLYIASQNGHVDVVRVMLNKGGNVNQCDKYGDSPLYIASQNGHFDVVCVLLDKGGNVNQCNKDGLTPLLIASYKGHVNVVRLLLDKGGNVNQYNKDGVSPLHVASENGHVDVVRVLLDKGGNVNKCHKDGVSPLHIASRTGHVDVVRVLLDKGGNVNQCNKDGVSPLHIASRTGHVDVVRVLLDKGGNVNQCNKDGVSPLHIASRTGHVDVVRVLLDKGGNVNQCNKDGVSPLHIASQTGHVDVVRVLLDKGGNVNQCNKDGVSPLHIASRTGHVDVVSVLLDKGGNANHCNKNGKSPLYIASDNGHVDVVRLLLDKGGNVNQCDKDGYSPLSISSLRGHVDVVHLLLDKGGNVNQCNKGGQSPLYLASDYGHVDVVRLLLDSGGNVNQCDEDGDSPLSISSQNGHVDVVRMLLDKGGNVNQCNKTGVSPLYISSQNGHVDVVHALLDKGGNVNQCDEDGDSPLYIASQNGHVDAVHALLDKGGNVNQCANDGDPPLTIASYNGHMDVVRVLLDKGGNVNQCDEDETTPFWIACYLGYLDVVRVMLDHGADIDRYDVYRTSPLCAAAHQGQLDVVRTLLVRGANVNAYNIFAASPLTAAAMMGHANIVLELIQHGGDVNMATINGFTPLAAASGGKHYNIVIMLIKHEATIQHCDVLI